MVARVLFMSTPEFGIPTLRLLVGDRRFEIAGVITQPDRPAGRGRKLTPPPVKVAAQELAVPVLQPPSLKSLEVQETIRALSPDLCAVAAYGQWIPPEVFDFPPKRSVNLHPSLLPRHRGAAPVAGALLAGDRETGLSVHFVENEMDVGALLAQARVPIAEEDTTGSLMAKLATIGAPLFVETLAAWVAGQIEPWPQNHAHATWIDRLQKGAGLIDWSLPAETIARQCRAFCPWPGTFTFYRGKRLLLHEARVLDIPRERYADAGPGGVMKVGTEIGVVTGDGFLGLEEVQLEGRRPLTIEDFCRGQRSFLGATLG
jgi:methionyl-tRNA formyltransferase